MPCCATARFGFNVCHAKAGLPGSSSWGKERWGGQRDSNPQQQAPQAWTLPLSYSHQPDGKPIIFAPFSQVSPVGGSILIWFFGGQSLASSRIWREIWPCEYKNHLFVNESGFTSIPFVKTSPNCFNSFGATTSGGIANLNRPCPRSSVFISNGLRIETISGDGNSKSNLITWTGEFFTRTKIWRPVGFANCRTLIGGVSWPSPGYIESGTRNDHDCIKFVVKIPGGFSIIIGAPSKSPPLPITAKFQAGCGTHLKFSSSEMVTSVSSAVSDESFMTSSCRKTSGCFGSSGNIRTDCDLLLKFAPKFVICRKSFVRTTISFGAEDAQSIRWTCGYGFSPGGGSGRFWFQYTNIPSKPAKNRPMAQVLAVRSVIP